MIRTGDFAATDLPLVRREGTYEFGTFGEIDWFLDMAGLAFARVERRDGVKLRRPIHYQTRDIDGDRYCYALAEVAA